MSADVPGGDAAPLVEEVFARYLERVEAGEMPDFEALCDRHGAMAEDLRRLERDWREAADAPGGQDTSSRLLDRLGRGERFGLDLDTGRRLGPGGTFEGLTRRLVLHSPPADRYTIEGEIARGGMGAILKAWDEDLRRNVAMKTTLDTEIDAEGRIRPDVDPVILARFLEEAQIAGQLDHPGIVPVHELGVSRDGRIYFTMRLVRGTNFHEVIKLVHAPESGWSLTRALSVLLRVSQAMAYAHSKGVIHRDLKPANIMVGRFGETYVMDWGLAHVLGTVDTKDVRPREERMPSTVRIRTDRRDELESNPESPVLTLAGEILGTPAYMSPEQASAMPERMGRHSDVYSVGTILYHLLAGHAPYMEEPGEHRVIAVYHRVLAGPPTPLRTVDPEIPEELAAICEKAMRREPEERYPDMEAFADDLRAFLEDRPVRAYAPSVGYVTRLWVRRHRKETITGAAALLCLILVCIWYGVRLSDRAVRLEAAYGSLERQRLKERTVTSVLLAESAESSPEEMLWAAAALAAKAEADDDERSVDHWPEQAIAARGHIVTGAARIVRPEWTTSTRPDEIMQIAVHPSRPLFLMATSDAWTALWEREGALWKERERFSVAAVHGAAAFAPSAPLIAVGANDGRVRVWNYEEDKLLATLHEEALDGRPVTSLIFTSDGTHLVAASAARIACWRVDSGEVAWSAATSATRFLAVAEGSGCLALLEDGRIERWRGGHVAAARDAGATCVAVDPRSGQVVTGGGDGAIRFWSEDLEPAAEPPRVPAMGLGALRSLAFDAAGDRLVVTGGRGGKVVETRAGAWQVRGELRAGSDPLRFAWAGFSAAGDQIVALEEECRLRVWNARDFGVDAELCGHRNEARSVAFSPDGRRLVSAGPRGEVYLWDTSNGRLLEHRDLLPGKGPKIHTVTFADRGKLVAAGCGDGRIRLFDADLAAPAPEELNGHDGDVTCLLWDAQRSRLLSAGADGAVLAWRSDAPGRSWGAEVLVRHGQRVETLALAEDGRLLAFGDVNGTVEIRSAESGEPVTAIPSSESVPQYALAFSPDGSRLAVGERATAIRIHDVATGKHVKALTGHRGFVRSLRWTGDGYLVSGGTDGTVRVWLPHSGGTKSVLEGHTDSVWAVAVQGGTGRIATASADQTIRLWPAARSQMLTRIECGGDVTTVAFHPARLELALSGLTGTIERWSIPGNAAPALLRPAPRNPERVTYTVCYAPDGRSLFSAGFDGGVRVWNLETGGAPQCGEAHGASKVFRVAAHPDPNRHLFASGDTSGRAFLWWRDGQGAWQPSELTPRHENQVWGLAFHPHEPLLVSVGEDGEFYVWNVSDPRKPLRQVTRNVPGHWLFSAAFDPEGGLLVIGGDKGLVQVWDAGSWQPRRRLEGHAGQVRALAFSGTGYLATANRPVRIWRTEDWRNVAAIDEHEAFVHSVAFSCDGRYLASASEDGTARIFDCLPLGWVDKAASAEVSGLAGRRLRGNDAVPLPTGRLQSAGR